MSVFAEIMFQALLLADARQTHYSAKHPEKWVELNPVVNKVGRDRYFVAAAITHAAISYTIPKKYLPAWQYGTIAIEGFVVARNARMGVRMSF